MYRRAVRPSILGISRSSVMTSGLARGIFLSANTPSMAVFTTSSSGSFIRTPQISFRMRAESSTTITRTFPMVTPLPFASAPHRSGNRSLELRLLRRNQRRHIHDQDDLSVPQDRGAGGIADRVPVVFQDFDHQLLLSEDPVHDETGKCAVVPDHDDEFLRQPSCSVLVVGHN